MPSATCDKNITPSLSRMSRKIYFCGSIRAGFQDRDLYLRIIKQLGSYGEVLTELVFDKVKAEKMGRLVKVTSPKKDGKMSDKEHLDICVKWLTECDAVVAEVTQPSLGVGYEIGRAVALGKKILCLYRPQPERRLSAMIAGAPDGSSFFVHNYKEEDVPSVLKDFFAKL